MIRQLLVLLAACALHGAPSLAWALGQAPFVTFDPAPGAFALFGHGRASPLHVDRGDHAGVLRAARDLQADIERVTGTRPVLVEEGMPRGETIIAGTLGRSPAIDALAASGRIDAASIRGRWEAWLVQVVEDPMPGVDRALVVAGADKRGTIFGLYEISEQIGVSPWYWWADVPVAKRASVHVLSGTRVNDAPVVQYRGIFLNDEEPALSGWAREKFGGYNHRFYAKLFELMLRLRANYLWPAMWNSAFHDDDPLNGKLADEYGVVVGTSHHEPMMRAHREWHRGADKGPWDYARNAERLREFWRGGLAQSRGQERAITLGMRGDGDEPMSRDANVALLERIVADQRAIIAEDPAARGDLQVWALYKEVQEYYERGMHVPDDVLLLWCDDNWGNIRRLPTPEERRRPGGAGVYYHFDYVGGPRSYKWINVTPLPKVWEQMHLAWKHEATRLWIVNVGDLKPMEVPTEFFLHYAWNPARWPAERLRRYLELWAEREFGPRHAKEIAALVAGYAKFNGRRKPEQLEPGTYSLHHDREAERVVAAYNRLAQRAERIEAELPAAHRDAFYQLVLYPVKAGAVVNELYVAAARNRLYGVQGRASANDEARRVRELFALDAELTRRFHEDVAGGKWNHMMSQPHLGYTYWNQPPRNTMPAVTEVQVPRKAEMAIAIEGSDVAWPGRNANALVLPALDPVDRRSRYVEIFNRGAEPFPFAIETADRWLTFTTTEGQVERERRIEVGARWNEIPPGTSRGTFTVSGPEGRRKSIEVPVRQRPYEPKAPGFVEAQGVVSIEAEHYTRAVAPVGRSWLRIPDHGRTLSGMTMLPVEAPALTEADGMRLEYAMHLFAAGKVTVQVTLAPTQKFKPGEGLHYAISFDDEKPRAVNVHADESRATWSKQVSDGVSTFVTEHAIDKPGVHTLKFWARDPGLVLQKIVVDAGGLQPTYLGPIESPRIR